MTQIITDWTTKHEELMDRSIVLAHHQLNECSTFDDESLVKIIDAHPREQIRVNTTRPYDGSPEWRDGDVGNYSAEAILKAVKKGRLWLNVINPSSSLRDFRDITDQVYNELEQRCPRFKTRSRSENLLISSPRALVNYHVDPGPTMLWHLRGKKRVWVYPNQNQEFLSQENLERVCTREWEGWEIPYDVNLDEGARVFDLQPGEFIYWPQHSPHRVENLGELNVSLTTNHSTAHSFKRNAVYRANGFFRNKCKLPFRSSETKGVIPAMKVAAIMAARMTGLYSIPQYKEELSFRLDPDADDGYVDIVANP